jgi:hypothetical protein
MHSRVAAGQEAGNVQELSGGKVGRIFLLCSGRDVSQHVHVALHCNLRHHEHWRCCMKSGGFALIKVGA